MEPAKPPRIVTAIVKDLNPKLREYFDKLLRFMPMHVKQVHESFEYEPQVCRTRPQAHSYLGTFYILLLQKEIYNFMEEEALDRQARTAVEALNEYIKFSRDSESDTDHEPEDAKKECSDNAEELVKPVSSDTDSKSEDDDEEDDCPVHPEYRQKLVDSYQKFRDPKNATIDIIEDIFNTASLRRIYYGEPMLPFDPKLLNMNNVEAVIRHAATFDRNNISMSPRVYCEYFLGEPSFILDNILLLTNTSMRHFQVKLPKSRRHIYQLLLYALGVFVKEGKEIRKFKVYNPLLGFEYSFELPHLDFDEFLNLVREIQPL